MLARKISRAKWERADYLAETEIRADAISGCLRTTDDTLSWWRCTGDEEDVAEVALALASGPKMEKIEKIDVVVVPETDLVAAGLAPEPREGETPVKELRSRHVNVAKLDVERLTNVARLLAPRIRSGESVFPFPKRRLMDLFNKAIHDKRLDPNELSEKLREKLAKPSGAQAS